MQKHQIPRFHVYFWLRNKKNVYCYFSINTKKSNPFSTGVKVSLTDWDEQKNRTKSNTTGNIILDGIENRSTSLFYEFISKGIEPTPEDILNLFVKPQVIIETPTLVNFYSDYIESLKLKRDPATIKGWNIRLGLIKEFLSFERRGKLKIDVFDYIFCKRYEKYLLEQAYSHVYINRQIESLKKVFHEAVKFKYISENPIIDWEYLPEPPPKKVYLSYEEFRLFSNAVILSPHLQIHRDCYLLQCLTGLDYPDIRTLNINQMVEHKVKDETGKEKSHFFLEGYRNKGDKGFYSVYLVPEALKILNQYDWNIPCKSEQKYREGINKIAEMLNITKHLTPKTGRKTFGNRLDRGGVGIEAIMIQMGHNSIRTTSQYYVETSREKIIKMMEPVIKAG